MFRISRTLASVLFFACLALAITFPMVAHLDEVHYNGTARVAPGSDALFGLWHLWWLKTSVLGGKNPFETDLLFHPSGSSLVFSTTSIVNGLVAIPLHSWFSVVEIGNLIFLASIVLAGFGMSLFVHYLTRSFAAGLIGGRYFRDHTISFRPRRPYGGLQLSLVAFLLALLLENEGCRRGGLVTERRRWPVFFSL